MAQASSSIGSQLGLTANLSAPIYKHLHAPKEYVAAEPSGWSASPAKNLQSSPWRLFWSQARPQDGAVLPQAPNPWRIAPCPWAPRSVDQSCADRNFSVSGLVAGTGRETAGRPPYQARPPAPCIGGGWRSAGVSRHQRCDGTEPNPAPTLTVSTTSRWRGEAFTKLALALANDAAVDDTGITPPVSRDESCAHHSPRWS